MPIIDFDQIESKEIVAGYHAKFVHTDNQSFAFWDVTAGSVLHQHSHVHEQTSLIVEGEFELIIEGESHQLKAGDFAVIPSNAVHGGTAKTACKIVDTFYPVREEYK